MFVFAFPIGRLKCAFHNKILKSGLNVTFSMVCMIYSSKNIEIQACFVKIFHASANTLKNCTLHIVGIFFSYIMLFIFCNTRFIKPLSKMVTFKRTLTSFWCFYSLFTSDLCSIRFTQKNAFENMLFSAF
jgi:hypothetical protein